MARASAASKKQADPVEAAIKGMELAHIQCRDFGHSWRPYTASWNAKERAYQSQLKCQRCTTLRVRWLSARGEQLSGNYDYPDGYLVKGLGRLTGHDRDALRLQSVLAVLAPDTAEE